MLIRRTMKYKLITNSAENEKLRLFLKQFSFVYNGYLKLNQHFYSVHSRYMGLKEMFVLQSKLKKKFDGLEGFPSKLFDSAVIHLSHELNNLLPGETLKPKRAQNDMFFVTSSFRVNQDESRISIPTLRDIRYHNSKTVKGKIKYIALQQNNDSWYALIFYEYDKQNPKTPARSFIGIDVGLKEFAILSNGKAIPNPRFYRNLENKLIAEQKKLSRKIPHSKNWEKQRIKVQKIHQEIVQSRMNFLHKISSFIVRNYDVIGIEKLSIQSMVKNKKYAKSILDAGWAQFIKMLKYKALEHSKVVIEVERFYPSSQLCHKCGSRQIMPLHLRTFVCRKCQTSIDRDYNASINIENRTRELYSARKY